MVAFMDGRDEPGHDVGWVRRNLTPRTNPGLVARRSLTSWIGSDAAGGGIAPIQRDGVVVGRRRDAEAGPGGFERLGHQRLIVLARQPGGRLAALVALPERLDVGRAAAGAGAQRGADRQHRPAERAGLGVAEGDQAGLASGVAVIAGEDVPDVVAVAHAAAEPGQRMALVDAATLAADLDQA